MKAKQVFYFIFIITIFGSHALKAQEHIDIRYEDKIRIAEAKKIAKIHGGSIWPNFNKTPFTILLVTDQHEFLINHPYPSEDFIYLQKDEILQTDIYYRKQQFNKSFLATFPAVNGINCIVVGTPENTNLNSTQWIITLLHEHFHQYQYTSPNYHQDALKLGLSNGDKTGMWQLNYPFPYNDPVVNKKYNLYIQQLLKTIESRNNKSWQIQLNKLKKVRKKFEKSISENDFKYLLFQWYQEGIARYTEYAFLELLRNYRPKNEVTLLKDFVPFNKYIEDFYTTHFNNITNYKLNTHQRETVYDVGFAEALIIREKNPDWNINYLNDKFDLRKLY